MTEMITAPTASAENTTDPAIVATPRTPGQPGHLAPPFYWKPDNPWHWERPYAPAGFWTAFRHFDDRGELVLQLGRRNGTGSAKVTSSYCRWEPDRGQKLYVVRFDPISLSRRPRWGGHVSLRAFVQVNGYKPPGRELWGGTQYMAIRAWGPHIFRVGFEVELKAEGTYGEVIGKIADVDQQPVYQSRSATETFDGEPSLEEMQQMLGGDDGTKVELVKLPSFQEVVTRDVEVDEG